MDENQKLQLLWGLKHCENVYHSYVREHGKVDSGKIASWEDALSSLPPGQIRKRFEDHVKTSAWFPTPKDILSPGDTRGGEHLRKVSEKWTRNITYDPMKMLPDGTKASVVQPMPDSGKRVLSTIRRLLKESIEEDEKFRRPFEKA